MGEQVIRLGGMLEVATTQDVDDSVARGTRDLKDWFGGQRDRFDFLRIPRARTAIAGTLNNASHLVDFGTPTGDTIWVVNEVCMVFNLTSQAAYPASFWSVNIGGTPPILGDGGTLDPSVPVNYAGGVVRPLLAYNAVATFSRKSMIVKPLEHLYAIVTVAAADPATTTVAGVASVSVMDGAALLRGRQ